MIIGSIYCGPVDTMKIGLQIHATAICTERLSSVLLNTLTPGIVDRHIGSMPLTVHGLT